MQSVNLEIALLTHKLLFYK